MSVQRPFSATDMFKFNNINLDIWTETVCASSAWYVLQTSNTRFQYGISFYLDYLSRWPDLCHVQEAPSGRMMGYILGKAEGNSTEWHGHITALTVAPEYRRLSLARSMVSRLELVSDQHYKGFFVDLYVRCNNALAISMYEGFGYSVFRRVREYYGNLGVGKGGRDEEDAHAETSLKRPLEAFRTLQRA
ncbi:acyl-CoA N-acyltransferase [Scleroderma yunnanense]